jgi:quercetin dioxygenase-like cupin family protein
MPELEVVAVDTAALADAQGGVAWSHAGEQLNATLLSWPPGHRIEAHVNDEREVLYAGVGGDGVVVVEDDEHDLRAGVVLVVPRGARREVRAGAEGIAYVTAHLARGPLQVTPRSSRQP